MVSCFLAMNAKPAANARPSDEGSNRMLLCCCLVVLMCVNVCAVESQRTVKMGRGELRRRLLAGEFKEIKW